MGIYDPLNFLLGFFYCGKALPFVGIDIDAENSIKHANMPSCKLLIIDDDVDDAEILVQAFEQCGVCEVQYVYTAMQAFSYLESVVNKEDLPKLIVTDMHLPGITGNEFLHDLKKMELYKHILVIVLSSTKSPQEIQKAQELGALEYLIKPNSYAGYQKVAADIAERVLTETKV